MSAFTLIIANILLSNLHTTAEDWEKTLDKDDIVIYTRQLDFSRFKEFRAETEMEGTIGKFREILTDVDSYERWMPDCKSAEIVAFPNPDSLLYHMKMKVPFPFANRDVIQQLVFHQANNKLEIEISNKPGKVAVEEKYVRMPIAFGKWIVEQVTDDTISIHFQYLADPGGDIPAWMVNSFIVKNPHTMLKRMRTKMKD